MDTETKETVMTAGIEVHSEWNFSAHAFTPFVEDWQDLRGYALHLGFVTLAIEWKKGGLFEFAAPLVTVVALGQWWVSTW
jgi:hypothetical protein